MSFKPTLTPGFVRELKGLSKKHASLKKDLSIVIASLLSEPKQGKSLGIFDINKDLLCLLLKRK